ncbi:MAG TPA: ATP-binding cassette domain-containing protein [Puia sp.]|nr:ATP-binding cassette domain-containing protein [Puia sp.]
MTILEVTDLEKHFATQIAVNKVSFQLEEGSIFGLLGPNGAGKTTLIRMITGIFFPDNGNIRFQGRPFDPMQDIIRIGYMPEERGMYKKMKIGEQALYLARLKGLDSQQAYAKVKEWFIKFEMQSWWNKKVEDLSKGMQQKLQFVVTVLHEPKLIILDEPFSGLDPVNSNLIKDEIYGLARKGSSIIFSTHRMEQVEEICDHIILMNKGEKILDGSVGGVKQQFKENLFAVGVEEPASDGTSEAEANGWAPEAAGFEVVGRRGGQWVVKIRHGYRPNDVLRYFIDQGRSIVSFTEILPSLSDIFIRLVEGTPLARQFQPVNLER